MDAPHDRATSRLVAGGSAHPRLLTDPGVCHLVRRGRFDVFLVQDSRLDSRRRPLFSVGVGDVLPSLPVLPEPHLGLLAVGSIDSELEVLDAGTTLDPARFEAWIRAMGAAVSEGPPRERALVLHAELDHCAAGALIRGDPRSVRWLRLESGSASLGDEGPTAVAGDRLPLAGALQAEALTDLRFAVEAPDTVAARDLSLFNEACRTALTRRLGARAERSASLADAEEALDASLREMGRLAGRGAGAGAGVPRDPLQAALHHLFAALAIAPLPRAFERDARSGATPAARLGAILSHHRLLSRVVLLRPDWERQDGAPLLAWLGAERRPVALVCRRRRWFVLDGTAELPVDAAVAGRLSADALQVYPGLPDEPFSFGALFRFGLIGGGLDRARLAACLVAGAAFASLIPAASALLIDDVLPRGDVRTAQLVVVGLFITILARTVFEAVKGLVLLRSELRLEMRLQPALVARMMRLPSSFYRSYAVGDILDRVLGIQQARQLLAQHGLGAIVGGAFGLISLVPILLVDWRLALVTFGAALALGLVTAAVSYGELRHERRMIAQKGRLEGFVLQMLMGMAKLRASAAEPLAFQRWAKMFRAGLDHTIAAERWANWQRTVQTFLPELATVAIYSAIVVFMKGDALAAATGAATPADAAEAPAAFSAGAFVAVSAASAQVFGSITALAEALSRTLSAVPLIERARPIIATPLDEGSGDVEPIELKGAIDIRNLSFRYAPSSPLALDGLDLRIGAGEFVAVVGASGSGKSTLMRLLLGFEQPASGEIFYDGTSMRRIALPDLRRQMGVVLQNGKLFSGSIHENIAGQTGLGMDEAVAAARLVGLDRDIEAMPMGMHTVLLDGAATLSGGQRQRILIARALIGRPAVLLLDEATSALDNRTQAIVTETLAGLAVTRVAIAHRLSTIEAADRIVVMQRGRLVESGTYAELMALGGHFAAHARRQLL